ncbi:hypothetical protein BCR34DRAFT_593832 [Clohesyomyces aquaticus]|uniref:Short chain dehydrogenase/reductase n=1 Tax=Clohesyomyces aquaticus TaxID=1231657 RepID=A0A1Y1YEN6_9PLEO|nr:hypothetical protein BCR34DRAFT_593832 [Clohesyomyces aquaticus]
MASPASKVLVLITGANSGVGFELAHQLMQRPSYHILLGCRSREKGLAAVSTLQSRSPAGTGEFLHLDVTDDDTISAAESYIGTTFGKLDILVNNAAIATTDPSLSFRAALNLAFDTNATGPAALSIALAPLLEKSTHTPSPRIINVSSGVGSLARRLDPTGPMYRVSGIPYRASKTALSMITACHFVEFGPEVKVFAYDPGFTVSNLGPHNNVESGARSAEESVRPLVEVLDGKRDGEAGLLLHNTGVWPW